jgi:hypothetical protein
MKGTSPVVATEVEDKRSTTSEVMVPHSKREPFAEIVNGAEAQPVAPARLYDPMNGNG